MNEAPREAVTVQTWIECGLRLGFTCRRTMELARAEGVAFRTYEFQKAWRETRHRFITAGVEIAGTAA